MKKVILFIAFAVSTTVLSQEPPASANTDVDVINEEQNYYKKDAHASYYHDKFNGRKTASGRKFNNNDLTAAHKKLPFGTIVKVTNEANNKFVIGGHRQRTFC
ncbi:rare lipoprotein A (peptidoglycan hydrolase) [Flavobacterium sp. HSC-32F16]|nr:rare lipoprotein A (peptidoglycan hydrolase) [Flavobacterium sp. HSC-32F16]